MTEFSIKDKFFANPERERMPAGAAPRIGIVGDAIERGQVTALAALFPNVTFETIGTAWLDHGGRQPDILFAGVDAASRDDVTAMAQRLRTPASPTRIVVMLYHADVANTRMLAHAGAADVLPVPAGEATLALCLERLLARNTPEHGSPGKSGQVVALLKAGGGVGATALGVQLTCMLAERAGKPDRVCFTDLDLQSGVASLYFDLAEALTITDCLAVGEFLQETQFVTALATHKSGARLLAGPRELTALDALTPPSTDALISGLRRDFALTVVDLPSVWTAWTNRVLQLADRIVLVTRLSVPHVHLVRRQLRVLELQKLDALPLTLVCNAVTSEQQGMLSLKSAEGAIGRPFDIVVPDDARVMGSALNQGLTLSTVRRGTKLEKAVGLIADKVMADAQVSASAPGWW